MFYDFDVRGFIIFLVAAGFIIGASVIKGCEYASSQNTYTEQEIVAHGGGHFDPNTGKFVWNR